MSDDEEKLTVESSLYALRLSHEKLNETLEGQIDEAKHIDTKAMSLLRVSFTFSGVVAAIAYYIARQRSDTTLGTVDNPFTYAGLLFGVLSVFAAFATVYHTKLETEITAGDITKQATFGRKEMFVTFVQTYPRYIVRNDERLNKDKALLSISQALLAISVIFTTISGLVYVNNRSFEFYGILAVTFFVGCVVGLFVALLLAIIKL